MIVWLTILVIGVLTYATRLSFILLLGKLPVPEGVRRALHYVPVAVLSAIILPELVLVNGAPALDLGNTRLLAGVIAIMVAWFSRNAILTIAAGMGSLWLLQWLMPLLLR